MLKRWTVYGLSVISLLVIPMTDAHAIICPKTQIAIGGTCIARPGSVIFDVHAQGEGCKVGNFFAATISPLPGDMVLDGLVFCANRANNVPSGSTGGHLNAILGGVTGIAEITDKSECRGQIDVEASSADLAALTQFCKSGHVAVAFTPTAFQAGLCINDTSDSTAPCFDPIDTLPILCVHENPESIVFSRKLGEITGDPYTCVRCTKGDCGSCMTGDALNGTCPAL
jgi:hypothetical protein